MQGACPVGRDGEDCPYVARTVSRGRPSRRCRNHDRVLYAVVMIIAQAGPQADNGGEAQRACERGQEGATGSARGAQLDGCTGHAGKPHETHGQAPRAHRLSWQ